MGVFTVCMKIMHESRLTPLIRLQESWLLLFFSATEFVYLKKKRIIFMYLIDKEIEKRFRVQQTAMEWLLIWETIDILW